MHDTHCKAALYSSGSVSSYFDTSVAPVHLIYMQVQFLDAINVQKQECGKLLVAYPKYLTLDLKKRVHTNVGVTSL